MMMKQILALKPQSGVICVAPGSRVSDAARLLSERRIGAVMVAAQEMAPVGILSERDIVRELGRRGPVCLDEAVDDLMTRTIVGCAPDEQSDSVLAKMTKGRFRHMPVMEGGRMVGLISIGDVVKARLAELAAERDALQDMVMGH